MKNENAHLVNQFLTGNEGAFTTLVKKYQKSVHALTWRKVGDFHIAEEITQDTFLKAYQKLGTLKNPKQFAGWLYVIADRLCIAWHRKQKPPTESLETTSGDEVEASSYRHYEDEQREEASIEHRQGYIRSLLEKLPESERTVVTLHYLGEMTVKEISKFLGVSANTIKSRLQRARNRLKEQETMIQETLGSVHLPTTFTENIMKQVADIKPVSPTNSKPLIPWAISAATAIFIFLMIGVGSQYLSRFQKPYNLNAQSEITVEIIDAPIVLDTQAKPDLRNQSGRFDTIGKSSGAGPQVSEPVLLAAAQVEKQTRSSTKQQSWTDITPASKSHMMRVSSGAKVLAAGNAVLILDMLSFRSTDGGKTWTEFGFNSDIVVPTISPSVAVDENTIFRDGTSGLLRSTDGGESWHSFINGIVGTRIFNLVGFKNELYTSPSTGVSKSSDGGESWKKLTFGSDELTLKLSENTHSLISPKLAIADGVLYGAASTFVPNHELRIFRLSANRNVLVPIQGIPALEEAPSTTDIKDMIDKMFQVDRFLGFGAFSVSSDTFYVKHMQQLLRWKRGEQGWFNTGLTDTSKRSDFSDDSIKGFKLAVSEETVYVGKRDGSLFQSFDSGVTWKDLTANLPLRFERFNEIIFAGSTIYVATDAGVLTSEDGEHWRALTDTAGKHTLIDRMAVDTTTVYGVGDAGVYRLNNRDAWEKISPEVPDSVKAFVINNDRLYIVTEHRGMFHVSLEKE